MAMLAIGDGTRLALHRRDLVICLDVGQDAGQAASVLSGVLASVTQVVTVVLHGHRDTLVATTSLLAEMPGQDVWSAPESRPGGALERVAGAAAPADLVLLGAGCRLAPGWLEELSRAAGSDAVIATASALDAGLVDESGQPGLVGGGAGIEPGALARLEAPLGPCVYVRRSALELVGGFGADFAQRCQARGLAHVLAGTVLAAGAPVAGLGRGSGAAVGAGTADGVGTANGVGTGRAGGGRAGGRVSGPVAEARLRARLSRGELAVVVDGRRLNGALDGTRVHVCELIRAVAETGAVEVTALLPAEMDPDTRGLLERVDGLTRVAVDAAGDPPPDLRADVVHRPHQVQSPADLTLLAPLAPRLVLTQQDLIGFHARGYYTSDAAWRGYRELTRLAMGSADRVLFFSAHARAEALAEQLVEPARTEVVAIGTDGVLGSDGVVARAPAGVEGLDPGAEVILCLGTDMRHKNREFALALTAQLRREHAWEGRLVLAGPHVSLGSSQAAEASVLAADPGLAAAVRDLGEVTDAEREWLLGRATLVLYPTVHEGFGLVPYEAAGRGVPCLWAPGTALSELLAGATGAIVPWDPVAGAEQALALMRDPVARAANVAAVIAAGRALSWARTGQALVEAYRRACLAPPSPAGLIARTAGVMNGAVSPDGIRLVGPDGLLPADAERPLLAVLSRPRLAAPVLSALRGGYRLARRRSDAG